MTFIEVGRVYVDTAHIEVVFAGALGGTDVRLASGYQAHTREVRSDFMERLRQAGQKVAN